MRWLASIAMAVARQRITGRPVPLSVTAAPTNRCQGSCRYCAIPGAGRDNERTPEWWTGMLEALHGLGMRRLGLTGGEPLLYEGLASIVTRARRLGVLVSMGTNGLLVPARREIVSQLDYLVVSVDGPREHTDEQRFVGAYDAAMAAIEVARRLGVPVWVTSVMTRANVRSVDDLIAWAIDNDLKVNLQLPFHPKEYCGLDNRALFPTTDEIRALLARVRPLSGPGGVFLNSRAYWDHVARWSDWGPRVVPAESRRRATRCAGGSLLFHIEPDGRVYPCTHQVGALSPRAATDARDAFSLLRAAKPESCSTCLSAYAQEQSLLLGGHPGALVSWAASVLPIARRRPRG